MGIEDYCDPVTVSSMLDDALDALFEAEPGSKKSGRAMTDDDYESAIDVALFALDSNAVSPEEELLAGLSTGGWTLNPYRHQRSIHEMRADAVRALETPGDPAVRVGVAIKILQAPRLSPLGQYAEDIGHYGVNLADDTYTHTDFKFECARDAATKIYKLQTMLSKGELSDNMEDNLSLEVSETLDHLSRMIGNGEFSFHHFEQDVA